MMSIQTSVWDVLKMSGKNTGMIPDEPRRAPNVPSHLSIENSQLHCTRSVGGLLNISHLGQFAAFDGCNIGVSTDDEVHLGSLAINARRLRCTKNCPQV